MVLKMAEQIEMTDLKKEMREQPTTPGKYTGLGAAIAAELMTGFWFGIGIILAVGGSGQLELLRWCTY